MFRDAGFVVAVGFLHLKDFNRLSAPHNHEIASSSQKKEGAVDEMFLIGRDLAEKANIVRPDVDLLDQHDFMRVRSGQNSENYRWDHCEGLHLENW